MFIFIISFIGFTALVAFIAYYATRNQAQTSDGYFLGGRSLTAGVIAGSAAEAVVVALKSRTAPVAEAVEQSLTAMRWLQAEGAKQIISKYCSTFDSTDDGNIGPVADALLDELKSDFTIACPAFPENGRTIYLGHLFVGGELRFKKVAWGGAPPTHLRAVASMGCYAGSSATLAG